MHRARASRPARSLSVHLMPGLIAAGVCACIAGVALMALLLAGTQGTRQGSIGQAGADWAALARIVRFTVIQAILSGLLAMGLAVGFGRALARRRFVGRRVVLALLPLPMITPLIVGGLGILSVYGQQGWLAGYLARALGEDVVFNIYGWPGILLAHGFFNTAFLTRLVVQAYGAVRPQTWAIARQLGIEGWQRFYRIEWPLIRTAVFSGGLLVVGLCLTSFVLILMFGGGPGKTTLEVAIYQSLRIDFAPARAGWLALLQLALCAVFVVLFLGLGGAIQEDAGNTAAQPFGLADGGLLGDGVWLVLGGWFALAPLLAVALSAAAAPWAWMIADPIFYQALLTSLAIGIAAGLCGLLIGGSLVWSACGDPRWGRFFDGVGTLWLVMPPLALSAGLFLALRAVGISPIGGGPAWGVAAVIGVNGLMAVPFVIRILRPPAGRIAKRYTPLTLSVGLRGWRRLWRVEAPLLRRPAALALALGIVFSLGDLGVMTLFGSPRLQTLPLYLYQLMAGYRIDQAMAVAGFLLLLSLAVFAAVFALIAGRYPRDGGAGYG
ncbi:MAG: ABC transporter permease subunit [Pseudomonadota bacterium]